MHGCVVSIVATDALVLNLNSYRQSVIVSNFFQTWLLIDWQHSCQPIRSHVRKYLWTWMLLWGIYCECFLGKIGLCLTPKHWEMHGYVVSIVATDALVLNLNSYRQSVIVSNFFQTWLLIDWQHSCQPIRSHVRNTCEHGCCYGVFIVRFFFFGKLGCV